MIFQATAGIALTPGHCIAVTGDDLAQMVREVSSAPERALDFEGDGLRWEKGNRPIGYALGYRPREGGWPRAWYVPIRHHDPSAVQADPGKAKQAFEDALKGAPALIGHNLKFDLNYGRADGWVIPEDAAIHDTMVQGYMTYEKRALDLESLAANEGVSRWGDPFEAKNLISDFLQSRANAHRIPLKKDDKLTGRLSYMSRFGHIEVPVAIEGEYACRDISHTLCLDAKLRSQALGKGTELEERRAWLYANEMTLVRAIAEMEWEGQVVDKDYLVALGDDLTDDTERRAKALSASFGVKIKWSSDQAVRDLVYGYLKLPVARMTSGGRQGHHKQPSVDRAALEELSGLDPRLKDLAEYKARLKALQSFTYTLAWQVGLDGKIHPSFLQTGTDSGRFSCVSGATQLETSRGVFRFDEYRPIQGDLVPTHTGAWRPVVRKIYKGVDRMYRVCLSNGAQVECTAHHRLLTRAGWRCVGDLKPGDKVISYGGVEEVGWAASQPGSGGSGVSGGREADDSGCGRGGGDHASQCDGGVAGGAGPGSIRGGEGAALLAVEDGRAEPYAGQEWRPTPSLHRGREDQGRVPAAQGEWALRPGPQDRDGGGAWLDRAAGHVGSASHRRDQTQQRPGQLGAAHASGPPAAACDEHAICEITPLGAMGVWDIEVEGAHSYASQGLFHHNSKEPNFQNVPKRHKELAKRIRTGWPIAPGRVRLLNDYSQIELRMLAWICGAKAFVNAYRSPSYDRLLRGEIDYEAYRWLRRSEAKVDVHSSVACSVFRITPEHPDHEYKRRSAKIVNFGVPYGGGANLLIGNPEIRMAPQEAEDFLRTYHSANPEITDKKRELFGRMLARRGTPRFANWASRTVHGPRLRWNNEEERAEEERSMFACLVQGAAGELTRVSLVRWYRAWKSGNLPCKATSTIHDEIQYDLDVEWLPYVASQTQRLGEDFTGMFGSTPVVLDQQATTTTWADAKEYDFREPTKI